MKCVKVEDIYSLFNIDQYSCKKCNYVNSYYGENSCRGTGLDMVQICDILEDLPVIEASELVGDEQELVDFKTLYDSLRDAEKNALFFNEEDNTRFAFKSGIQYAILSLLEMKKIYVKKDLATKEEPQKRNKWIKYYSYYSKYDYPRLETTYGCRVCGNTVTISESEESYKYCPHCGAKMYGNEGNEQND